MSRRRLAVRATGPLASSRTLPGALLSVALAFLLGGCAAPAPYDYSALRRANPASLLVLPPVNDSPDVRATPAVWASATRPLAEAGYYVLPITLVDETFVQNGVTTAHDAQAIPYPKLREQFGADAAVYLRVIDYGTRFQVIGSETRVEVEARVVDLRDGALLWQGRDSATTAETAGRHRSGLAGLVIGAVIKQVVESTSDSAYHQAVAAGDRLLGAPRFHGILPGPRSPHHGKAVAQ